MSIGAAYGADKIVLRFSSVSPPPGQSLDSDGAKWWMDKVTERTKGQVTFETFWGEAEEILQEVFTQLLRSPDAYRPEKAAFSTWLNRITMNRCLNRRRRLTLFAQTRQRQRDQLRLERNAELAPDETDGMRESVRRLSPPLRAVIVLRLATTMDNSS